MLDLQGIGMQSYVTVSRKPVLIAADAVYPIQPPQPQHLRLKTLGAAASLVPKVGR